MPLEGSFGKLDNKSIAKGLLPSLLEPFGRFNAAKRSVQMRRSGDFPMQKGSEKKKERARGKSAANEPECWIAKRADDG